MCVCVGGVGGWIEKKKKGGDQIEMVPASMQGARLSTHGLDSR